MQTSRDRNSQRAGEPAAPPRPLDVAACRAQFPGLRRRAGGRQAVFLDGPAGSQVPDRVIQAVSRYLAETNANSHGVFDTSLESDALLDDARAALADLLGSPSPDTVAFGPNMTTLTFWASRALSRTWGPGDGVVATRLEHDANASPWEIAARDAGATFRWAPMRAADCTLDLEALETVVDERTRLIAVSAASNAVGTIQPIRRVSELARRVGAEVFVDAVHYAPHGLIDVVEWDCDYLVCSAYKFFGPHVAVLWGRRERLARLPVDKLRVATDDLPFRWMTGTQNHEGIVGAGAAVDYLESIGRSVDDSIGDGPDARRASLRAAFLVIGEHERSLAARLLSGLRELPAYTVLGIRDLDRLAERVPTVSVTHRTARPIDIARHLAARGMFVWHGNFYALPVTETLDLEPEGMVRIGLLHYNTEEEVDALLEALGEIA